MKRHRIKENKNRTYSL